MHIYPLEIQIIREICISPSNRNSDCKTLENKGLGSALGQNSNPYKNQWKTMDFECRCSRIRSPGQGGQPPTRLCKCVAQPSCADCGIQSGHLPTTAKTVPAKAGSAFAAFHRWRFTVIRVSSNTDAHGIP